MEACTDIAQNVLAAGHSRAYALSEPGLAREANRDFQGAFSDYSEGIRIGQN